MTDAGPVAQAMEIQATDTIGCMIVGVHKCGTTSLRDQLAEHPGIATHPQLECPFYDPKVEHFEPTGRVLLDRYFADAAPRAMLLAKHATACCDDVEIERIAAANPGCRLILTVRDPVARARSAYMMETSFGHRQAPFPELVEQMLDGRVPESDWRTRIYLSWGRYDAHLDRLRRSFDPGQIRVVAVEELRREPRGTIDGIFEWLGLEHVEIPIIEARNVASHPRSVRLAGVVHRFLSDNNPLKPLARRVMGDRAAARAGGSLRSATQVRIEKREELDAETRESLREYFGPSVDRLGEMTGQDFRAVWGWEGTS